MSKTWRIEDRFRYWEPGKKIKKIGDDFADWAIQYKKDYEDSLLEEELKELFVKELHEQK